MASPLDLDPRWRALQERGGVMDVGFDHPAEWPHAPRGDAFFVKDGDDQLTAELCRLGDARFIKATASLPIRGSDETLGLAFWAQVPAPTFYTYLDTFEGGPAPDATLATLASDISPLATPETPLSLDFGDGTERPRASFETGPDDISLDDLLALYEATGALTRDDLRT